MTITKPNALQGLLKDKTLLKMECYINGKWVGGNATINVTNPVDESLIGTVPKLGTAETKVAIEAAAVAQKAWGKKTAKERSIILRKWFNLMIENAEDLAQIMTAEQGKPLGESRGEVVYGASFIEFFAEEAKRVYGETIPIPMANSRAVVIKQPIGVVAAITPWNFPNAMITRKAGPALALAELADRAGIPAGVFSVITGKASEIGGEMTANPIVKALTFTGSTEIGRVLMAQCAPTVKRMGLELGGNAPFIVFDDADLDAAVAGAMIS
jgi:succinate-semialdehyde dehydrogenase / glutarate-semialdehyde dehydrogenase